MTWNTDDMQPDYLRLYEAKTANAERAAMGMDDEPMYAPDFDPIDEAGSDALTGQPVESSWLAGVPWARDDEDVGFTGERIDVAAGPGAEIRNLPPEHPALNAIGEFMQAVKGVADKYEVKDWVPLLGGMGVGELLMGQGPEWLKDAAHGFGMQTVPIAGGVRIPDKRALDAGFMAVDAGALATGAAKVAPRLINEIAKDMARTGMTTQGGQIAWHGSPHKFDKFDMSKIGTGEGAQAYGHGLYMAESPAVAKSYQDNLAPGWKPTYKYKGKDASYWYENAANKGNYGDAMLWEQVQLHRTRDAIRETLLDEIEGGSNQAKQALKTLDTLPDELFAVPGGAMYKVDIPDEAITRMLDWDKPLSEQPNILAALRDTDIPAIGRNSMGWRGAPDEMWEKAMGRRNGEWLYREMLENNQVQNSAKLKELGIHGIRYLDGGSRNAGKGTYNYVLFDDQLPRILEVNGKATGEKAWQPGEWKPHNTKAKP